MHFIENVLWLLRLIGVMINMHELGHYLAARFFDVRVEAFSFGFGTRLFCFRRGETDFRFSAIPFGGYVKMAGETVTCSPHLAETRAVVAAVRAGRGDAELLDAPAVLSEVPDLQCPQPYARYAQFWPHRHGTDAIFLALLRRTQAPAGSRAAGEGSI